MTQLRHCKQNSSICFVFFFYFFFLFSIFNSSTSLQEEDQLTTRRYDYIRYDSGMVFGQPSYCQYEIKLKSWIRWFVSCSYCFCYCDHNDNQLSDRAFSLREAVSTVAENKYDFTFSCYNILLIDECVEI